MMSGIMGMDVLWLDELITVSRLPEDNGSIPIEQCSRQGGGKVATALATAGRLGVPCKLLAVAGDSGDSHFLVEDLERHGVDTSGIRVVPGYREGFSVVLSDQVSGGRRIFWHPGSEEGGLTQEDVEHAAPALQSYQYLHLCRIDQLHLRAAEIARQAGVLVSFDADFYDASINQALPLLDILIGSEEFYQNMFPNGGDFWENIRTVAQAGPSTVIFTFGSKGCRGIADGRCFTVPAFTRQIKVIDTVGAGDVFHGAYLAALCMGIAGGEEAARFASAVSALKCTAIGGRAGIPTRAMVEQYLAGGDVEEEETARRTAFYRRN